MRPLPRLALATLALCAWLAATPVARADSEEEFPVALGDFATTMTGSVPDRTLNVRLAAAALDGVVVEPDDVLSFDAVVGPRSPERGYRAAPVILHETRQLQTGGGVCQVASTVFVAALLSGFDVVERWRHSSPVDYVALGEDATIAWRAKDLRLRNTSGQRVRLRVTVTGAAVVARFEGAEEPEATFELHSESRTLPADDASAGPGREVTLFRVRRDAAGESREVVHRDTYPPTRVRS
ncbi:MAG: VanW family protein [bacterium]